VLGGLQLGNLKVVNMQEIARNPSSPTNIASTEEDIWRGTPSQIHNIGSFIWCGLLCFMIVPVFVALWRYYEVKTTVYEITTERLKTRSGVLSVTEDELELFRVKDFRIDRPFWLRMFGLSNLVLVTSDETTPIVVVCAIRDASKLREILRTHTQRLRQARGVREIDYN